MGLDHVLLDFFTCTAIGAASVLLVIACAGVSIRRRSPVSARRLHR
jgi:hypothetical protein